MLRKTYLSFASIYLLSILYHSLSDALAVAVEKEMMMHRNEKKQFDMDKNKFNDEKKKISKYISQKMSDVVRLNVGGELMITTRKTLTSISSSILAKLFNGRWEEKMHRDDDEHIFLDFNPVLFRHLLEQLRQYKTNPTAFFTPPSSLRSSSSLNVQSFERMLKKLGLHSTQSSLEEMFSMNVGGDRITTRKNTLNSSKLTAPIPRSIAKNKRSGKMASEIFIDADPSLFRTLLARLRGQQRTNRLQFEALSSEKIKTLNRMLNSFGLTRFAQINATSRWTKIGKTVAGGHGQGNALNQFHLPSRLDIDDDGTLVIADWDNNRIVQWKPNATQGEAVAGGRGRGSRIDQLNRPTAVLIDRINHSFIISDRGNRRVMRWSLDQNKQNGSQSEVIISDVYSLGLAMDNEGSLYVSDYERHEVRRYGRGDHKEGEIVAGGNGQGAAFNQLDRPRNIFIDQDYSIYISDMWNHRVMKWSRNAKEGILIAGGQGHGNRTGQFSYPCGIFVDSMGSLYVADQSNNRVMRWLKDVKQGEVIVGGNGPGSANNQLHWPASISVDQQGNLYVLDRKNDRVQRFDTF